MELGPQAGVTDARTRSRFSREAPGTSWGSREAGGAGCLCPPSFPAGPGQPSHGLLGPSVTSFSPRPPGARVMGAQGDQCAG